MYFFVGDRTARIAGYAWRIGWNGTSFYIKPTWKPLSGLKISLHGPDPRHSEAVFLVGRDDSAGDINANGGLFRDFSSGKRSSFCGAQVAGTQSVLAVRFRSSWKLFKKGAASAPRPVDLKPKYAGAYIQSPSPFHASDVDLFVTQGFPYWPNEAQARGDNACMGPLCNDANQL
jgi:hypothetical protein